MIRTCEDGFGFLDFDARKCYDLIRDLIWFSRKKESSGGETEGYDKAGDAGMAEWVVIVDDDTVNLKRTGMMLADNGIHATAIRSGKALVEFLRTNTPDLILLDILMPEMDGFETLRRIREEKGPGFDVPVIYMTADSDAGLDAACASLGAAGLIRKPLDAADLVRRIRQTIPGDAAPAPEKPENKCPSGRMDLETVSALLEKMDLTSANIWMGREALTNVYRYALSYMDRYHGTAVRVLITVNTVRADLPASEQRELILEFRRHLQQTLRVSDLLIEINENQFFLLLQQTHDYETERIIHRLLETWNRTEESRKTVVTYETGQIRPDRQNAREYATEYSVAIVDDDPANLLLAQNALSGENIRVTALRTGEALLEYVAEKTPDLILLDILMPGMDGFETMEHLKDSMRETREIPVIFLTADDNRETEKHGLQLGATDFIRKPFLPEVLALRVRHAIELDRFQRDLAQEVDVKTKENEGLSLRIVQALAAAIDAKDAYTNGHSGRVADYAVRIAAHFGYSIRAQQEIYMAGLLHDVGKIGVPDEIINKPGKLTAEEYEIIKTHPAIGDRILKTIRERPELAVAARWHHERYNGTGYPDGLAGNAIPEIARIIAVADAYDAMTSRRSYRDILPAEEVRSELEKGKGTQFDPAFADIMLSIMDEESKGQE